MWVSENQSQKSLDIQRYLSRGEPRAISVPGLNSPYRWSVVRDDVTDVDPHDNQRVHRQEHVSALVDLFPDIFHAVSVPNQDLFPPDDPAVAGERKPIT